MKKYVLVFILSLLCYEAQSHSGRTDSRGGHYNRKTGTYHYHNGGSVRTTSKNFSAKSYDNEVKITQQRLNKLGFDCGEPDGVMGIKTREAIKDFQRSKGLKPDGVPGQKTMNSLNAEI